MHQLLFGKKISTEQAFIGFRGTKTKKVVGKQITHSTGDHRLNGDGRFSVRSGLR